MCCWGWEERGQQIGQRAAILLRGLGGGAEASWRTPSLLFTGRVEEMYEAKMEIYPGTWKVALLDLKYSFWIKIAMGLGIWPTDQNTPCGPTQEFWPASQSMLSIHKCHARYQWWLKDLGSLCTRPGLSSWHLALAWYSPDSCGYLEGETANGRAVYMYIFERQWDRAELVLRNSLTLGAKNSGQLCFLCVGNPALEASQMPPRVSPSRKLESGPMART